MNRISRSIALFSALILIAAGAFAQQAGDSRPLTGTIIDVDEGRSRLQIEPDGDSSMRVVVEADALATTYYGFGTVIAGKPEIFTGSSGFSNLRLGDRVEVRGGSRGQGVIGATQITLLGRDIPADPTGVGQTRTPTSAATPTENRPTGVTPTTRNSVEGTVRQINGDEGRIMIQTPQRRMVTVRTYRNTPVTFRGQAYRVSNIQVGDRIRVDVDPRDTSSDELAARRIEVTQSVQENPNAPNAGGVITVIDGRITRIDPTLNYLFVDDGRSEVRVDMGSAENSRGDTIDAAELHVGERVEISGSFNREGDMFLGSTVRVLTSDRATSTRDETPFRLSIVTITGTVSESLEDGGTIAVHDRDSGRTVRIWVTDDFSARTKSGSSTAASNIRVNDTVVIKAFRDSGGDLIAQTIRIRNR